MRTISGSVNNNKLLGKQVRRKEGHKKTGRNKYGKPPAVKLELDKRLMKDITGTLSNLGH